MIQICRWIDAHCAESLPLSALAARAGLSPFYFQRRFKAVVGVTPKEYAESRRLESFKREVRAAKDVTEAVYAAGFGSSSRVYERATGRFGMTPGEYRNGAPYLIITYASMPSPMGPLMLAATDRGLCSVQFGSNPSALLANLKAEFPRARLTAMARRGAPAFRAWAQALRRHLDGRLPDLALPVDVRATAFQMLVWNFLRSIPYGQTRTYTQVATGIGRPTAIRAVASACARNRLALVVPCHRVIRGTGNLAGYRWGLERKGVLLEWERKHAVNLGSRKNAPHRRSA